jgi:hypothetical protein
MMSSAARLAAAVPHCHLRSAPRLRCFNSVSRMQVF